MVMLWHDSGILKMGHTPLSAYLTLKNLILGVELCLAMDINKSFIIQWENKQVIGFGGGVTHKFRGGVGGKQGSFGII